MSNYIVIKEYTDGTYTTEFFREKSSAKKYAAEMRNNRSGIIKSVTIYAAVKDD